jgi:hypothetical protein
MRCSAWLGGSVVRGDASAKSSADTSPLIEATDVILDPYGGRLFAGFELAADPVMSAS